MAKIQIFKIDIFSVLAPPLGRTARGAAACALPGDPNKLNRITV
jgi:hypothetical protein